MQVPTDNNEEMPRRQLGTTGEMVSCIGMGGYHIALPSVDEALGIRLIRSALDRGITFLDNCWDYNQGNSEIRMGKALADGYRDRAFLMTKIDGRTEKTAALQIDESLARLRTDRIDLVQFHEIVRFDDPDRIFAEERRDPRRAGGEEGRQDPLHRLHRPQRSAHSSADAGGGGATRLPLRHGADARQRDGRALPLIYPES